MKYEDYLLNKLVKYYNALENIRTIILQEDPELNSIYNHTIRDIIDSSLKDKK